MFDGCFHIEAGVLALGATPDEHACLMLYHEYPSRVESISWATEQRFRDMLHDYFVGRLLLVAAYSEYLWPKRLAIVSVINSLVEVDELQHKAVIRTGLWSFSPKYFLGTLVR